jgi:hypothetical protein
VAPCRIRLGRHAGSRDHGLDHLGAWIGHEAIIEGLEDKFARGEVSDREVTEGYAPFYRGVALADAAEVRSRIPSIDDIGLGVAMLRQRSVDALIATVSWSFAAQALGAVALFCSISVLGIGTCYLVRITGRLVPGMMVHATVNAVALLTAVLLIS